MSDCAVITFMGDLYTKEEDIVTEKFDVVKEKITDADLRVCNLESPIVGERACFPINKTGPNLVANENIVSCLKHLDINLVALANNHIGDFGEEGVKNTIDCLQQNKLSYIGAGEDIECAYEWYYCVINGLKIAILSVCENEFGMATENKAGAAGFDVFRMVKSINTAKEMAKHLIVVFHGGNEYNPFPSPEAQERYRFLIDMGVSVIVGMHTHCPQGYEYYNGGLIIYSLGNFYFPNEEKEAYSTWNMGYLAMVKLYPEKVGMEIVPYRYSIQSKQLLLLEKKDKLEFNNYIQEINEIILDKHKLFDYFGAWCIYGGKHYAFCLNWNEKYFEMDDYIEKSIEIQNVFRCESHRELLQTYFEIMSGGKADKYREIWNDIRKRSYIPIAIDSVEEALAHIKCNIQIKNIDDIARTIKTKESPVFICGAGNAGVSLYKALWKSNIYIKSFLDNQEALQGKRIGNVWVKKYDELVSAEERNAIFIIAIVNKDKRNEVKKQLEGLEISDDNIMEIVSGK